MAELTYRVTLRVTLPGHQSKDSDSMAEVLEESKKPSVMLVGCVGIWVSSNGDLVFIDSLPQGVPVGAAIGIPGLIIAAGSWVACELEPDSESHPFACGCEACLKRSGEDN